MSVSLYHCGCSGGTGGTVNYNEELLNVIGIEDCRISEIIVHSGDVVDSIAVSYVDSNDNPLGTFKIGGNGGSMSTIQLQKNVYIKGIWGCSENKLGFLQFEYSDNTIPVISYGSTINDLDLFTYNAPAGFLIIGFWGAEGDKIDRIGVILRRIPDEQITKRVFQGIFFDRGQGNK